jgi:hypothetical protein
MPSKIYYWSCSKFSDWIRGTPKLKEGTSKEWRDWRIAAQQERPIRFWIAEELLDDLQNFVYWPVYKLNDIKYYINNRWVSRSHALTAHPRDIKPGDWCDVGNRFLPCLFNELVDFVEIEQAWLYSIVCDDQHKLYNVPWWRSGWLRLRAWRSSEAGLAYLNWASTLTNKDFIEDGEEEELTHQAIAAKEIIELYNWWTVTYRNRPEPVDASGWSAYYEKNRDVNGEEFLIGSEHDDAELKEMANIASEKFQEIEEAYEKEETEMLVRLIKIRKSLWT